MKTSTKITILLAFASAALIAAIGVLRFFGDRRAPQIQIPAEMVTYHEGEDYSVLLAGVTATDNRDGDVTGSLRVESVMPSINGQAMVVYIAKDSRNNIGEASRTVLYAAAGEEIVSPTPTPMPTAEPEEEPDEEEPAQEEPTPAPTAEPTPTPAPTATPAAAADANEAGRMANEEKIAALDPAAPKLYLSEYAVTVPAGSEINVLSYISDIQDDTDAYYDLSRRVSVNGEVNTGVPGTYEVSLFATDSDGNVSNQAVLTVTVE